MYWLIDVLMYWLIDVLMYWLIDCLIANKVKLFICSSRAATKEAALQGPQGQGPHHMRHSRSQDAGPGKESKNLKRFSPNIKSVKRDPPP